MSCILGAFPTRGSGIQGRCHATQKFQDFPGKTVASFNGKLSHIIQRWGGGRQIIRKWGVFQRSKERGHEKSFRGQAPSPKKCLAFSIQHFFKIDLLAIQQKSLDRALFLYIFIHEIRLSGVRASITIVHIRKFYKM